MTLPIRFSVLVTAGFLMFAAAGCESVRNDFGAGVREKFSGPTYVTRNFGGESKVVFDAAKKSVEQLGFRVTRAGQAQGVIDGLSGITPDDRLAGSRQRTIKVRLSTGDNGVGTNVAVLLTEIVEDDFNKSAGQGTETSLRDSPLYDVFFNNLTQALVQ